MRGVLVFLDVIELVLEPAEVLRFDDIGHVLGFVCAFAVAVVHRESRRIVRQTWMLLDGAGLVNMGLPVLLNVLRGARPVLNVHILPDAEVSTFILDAEHLETGCSEVRDWVRHDLELSWVSLTKNRRHLNSNLNLIDGPCSL